MSCKINERKAVIDSSIISKETLTTSEMLTELPLCIREKIEAIKKGKVRNPPTVAKELALDGKKYYLIPSGCCDQFDYIIDENCKIVCSQGYGISGKFNNGCDTLKNATRTVIWRDKRNF
jgi:hypothetical protein